MILHNDEWEMISKSWLDDWQGEMIEASQTWMSQVTSHHRTHHSLKTPTRL